MSEKIEVLGGQGYVRLLDNMGDDLSVVNAARVSFDKESKKLELRTRILLTFWCAQARFRLSSSGSIL